MYHADLPPLSLRNVNAAAIGGGAAGAVVIIIIVVGGSAGGGYAIYIKTQKKGFLHCAILYV
jgi:hypothetical protein